MDGVKASRKAHSGVLTRARHKLDVIPFEHSDEVRSIKLTDVKSILKTLSTTEAGFSASLEEAQDFAPTDEEELATFQEEELEVAETFHERLHLTRTLGEQILTCKTVHTGITTFKTRMEALQNSLDAEPDRDHSTSLARLQTLLYSLREQWEDTDLSTEHFLQSELDRCEVQLSHQTGAVSTARNRSIPSTPPLSSTMASFSSTGAVANYSKLPMIKIPNFNGDIMGWSTFWATFESTVDSRPELNSSQKLNYLRQAIKDPALQLLMNSPLEGPDTYQDLVDELKDRYQKKKEIHQAVVKTITSIFSPKYTRADLRLFCDTLKTSITNLKATSHYDIESFLSSLAYSILPNKLQILWDQATKKQKGVLPITELMAFIKDHAETLPAATTQSTDKTAPAKRKEQPKGRNSVHATITTAPATTSDRPPLPYRWECILCKPEKHPLHVCSRWAELSLAPKLTLIESNALCSNCLHKGHTTEDCRSKYRCSTCKQKHHTSIHQQEASVAMNHATPTCHQLPDALMTTAQLLLVGPNGEELKARALIDSGAGISLVTLRAAQALNLSLNPAKLHLAVIQGEVSTPLKYVTQLKLSPLHNRALEIPCHPAVADVVTTKIPCQPVPSVTDMPHLRGLHLADETYNLPGHIDILLGAEMASKIFTRRLPQKGNPTEPMAHATEFGWSLLGPVPGLQHSPSMLHLLPRIQAEPSYSSKPQPETSSTSLLQEEERTRDATPTQLDQQVEKHHSDLHTTNWISDLGESTLSRFLTNENVSTMMVEARHTSEPLLSPLLTTNKQPSPKKLLTLNTDLLKAQPVSRNNILEQDLADLQQTNPTISILGEVIFPEAPSAECQTPQQSSLLHTTNSHSSNDSKPESQQQLPRNLLTSQSSTTLTTRSQPTAITPNLHSLRKITLPHNLFAECQTPQQICLPQATTPFPPNISHNLHNLQPELEQTQPALSTIIIPEKKSDATARPSLLGPPPTMPSLTASAQSILDPLPRIFSYSTTPFSCGPPQKLPSTSSLSPARPLNHSSHHDLTSDSKSEAQHAPSKEIGTQQTAQEEEVTSSSKNCGQPQLTSSLCSSAKDKGTLTNPINSQSVSRNNILEQQSAALQPPIMMISTRHILEEVSSPQNISTECQTPQQNSLFPAALPTAHYTYSTECQTPQQNSLLPAAIPQPDPLSPTTSLSVECQTPRQILLLQAAATVQRTSSGKQQSSKHWALEKHYKIHQLSKERPTNILDYLPPEIATSNPPKIPTYSQPVQHITGHINGAVTRRFIIFLLLTIYLCITSIRRKATSLQTRFGRRHYATSDRTKLHNWKDSSLCSKTPNVKRTSFSYHLLIIKLLMLLLLLGQPSSTKTDPDLFLLSARRLSRSVLLPSYRGAMLLLLLGQPSSTETDPDLFMLSARRLSKSVLLPSYRGAKELSNSHQHHHLIQPDKNKNKNKNKDKNKTRTRPGAAAAAPPPRACSGKKLLMPEHIKGYQIHTHLHILHFCKLAGTLYF